ncbi:hypothetical protein LSTR_LSTR011719 [Laodelphax striatellus]|uniref:Uncharacterized protein n=1 Tax=Laodelphax striatellus TaxID=195883 RepID=A0A482WQR1_LAOST|nr:hypothetical protein LSTR_LSTR011719 [Laodelphax striatellus]
MFNCTSRRHFREAEIVRKRVAEEDRIQKWSNVQGYYKACDLSNSRMAHWEGSTAVNHTKTPEMCIIEERKQNLETRRQQLKNLLAGEMLEWGEESRVMSGKGRRCSTTMQNLSSVGGNSQNFVTITGEIPQKLLKSKNDKQKIEVDDSKLEYLMGNMVLDEEQLNKLDAVDAEKFKKLLSLIKLLQSLSKFNSDLKTDVSLPRYEQWKQMCLGVQINLKKAINFIQEMRACVGDFQMSVKFLDRLLEQEKSLQECLRVESSEDRFGRLLEQTRREPNKWFHGEMVKWDREGKERIRMIENIYGEFQLLVKDWVEKNQEKISVLIESED